MNGCSNPASRPNSTSRSITSKRRREQIPPLTAKRARELFAYNTKTGALSWRKWRPGVRSDLKVRTLCNGYVVLTCDGRAYKAHRVIWLIRTGKWPTHQIDHVDRNRANNIWCNLRQATPAENSRNRDPGPLNKSGRVGVCWNKAAGKWQSYIRHNYRAIALGCFEIKDDAITARCEAEKHFFGSFAADATRYSEDARGTV